MNKIFLRLPRRKISRDRKFRRRNFASGNFAVGKFAVGKFRRKNIDAWTFRHINFKLAIFQKPYWTKNAHCLLLRFKFFELKFCLTKFVFHRIWRMWVSACYRNSFNRTFYSKFPGFALPLHQILENFQ